MAKATTGGGLRPTAKRGSFFGTAKRILTGERPARSDTRSGLLRGDGEPGSLQAIIRADRVRRRMTWAAYSAFLGVHLSTLHKIATGVHRASELTDAIIRDKLSRNP